MVGLWDLMVFKPLVSSNMAGKCTIVIADFPIETSMKLVDFQARLDETGGYAPSICKVFQKRFASLSG